MLKFDKFTGINNVVPDYRIKKSELVTATNVDIGLDNEITRRAGYTEISDLCHKNLWQADGYLLATTDSDLVKAAGGVQTVLYPSIGVTRMWYVNLPNGKTAFSNGLINGITDGTAVGTTPWGVPTPPSIGTLTEVPGDLHPGDYQYQITYVRLLDGLEGGPEYSNPVPITQGGVVLTGLPVLTGYKINVYLTSLDGGTGYYAGSTTNGAFSFTGKNEQLVLPCRTEFLSPAPAGRLLAFWRGRTLVAKDNVLYASKTAQWEHFDLRRDFKQFSAPITLVQPVDGGIFVGTTEELAFLGGTEFDKLVYEQKVAGPVVLGSGVSIKAEQTAGDGNGGNKPQGSAMICIADGSIVTGYSSGNVTRTTQERYRTTVTEVAAMFRMNGDIPQYVAIPQ